MRPGELGAEAGDLIEDGTQDVLVSVVSAWEIAIEQSLGRLELQALEEGYTLVTRDEALAAYGVPVLKA